MQFLQCSTTAIPVDFLASLNFTEGEDFADFQLANAFAQSQALLFGTGEGASETSAPGGRPSNLLLTVDDSLHSLGRIVSFYEHSTVFQAGLYGINPFDQWGVEEGKKIARDLLGRVPTSTLQVALEFFGDGVSGRFRS
jgi:glucose-6-phosphate isomerase